MTAQEKTPNSRQEALLARYRIDRGNALYDDNLKFWVQKLLEGVDFGFPGEPSLNIATCIAMDWNLAFAKAVYIEEPSKIKAVICKSPVPNALAVVGEHNKLWVVITTALTDLLHSRSDEVGEKVIGSFLEFFGKSSLGYRLSNSKPITQDFSTMLGGLMYFAGISFFTSHELGHHLGGHMPVFGVHAGSIDSQISDKEEELSALESQSLERNADQLGVKGAAFAVVHVLKRELYKSAAHKELEEVDYLVAILLSAGIPMAHVLLNPVDVDWSAAKNKKHPPHLYRLANMRGLVRESLDQLKLTDANRRDEICYRCFEPVIGKENMRKLIELEQSDELKQYSTQLDAAFLGLKDRLKPLMKQDFKESIWELVNGKVRK